MPWRLFPFRKKMVEVPGFGDSLALFIVRLLYTRYIILKRGIAVVFLSPCLQKMNEQQIGCHNTEHVAFLRQKKLNLYYHSIKLNDNIKIQNFF